MQFNQGCEKLALAPLTGVCINDIHLAGERSENELASNCNHAGSLDLAIETADHCLLQNLKKV